MFLWCVGAGVGALCSGYDGECGVEVIGMWWLGNPCVNVGCLRFVDVCMGYVLCRDINYMCVCVGINTVYRLLTA